MSKQLSSLHPAATAVVFGASGGIGGAVAARLQDDPRISVVHAFARSPLEGPGDKIVPGTFDLLDEASIADAVENASRDGPIDLVFVATGILHRGEGLRPEKSMRELDAAAMLEVFHHNTIGPALIAKHFLPQMRSRYKTVFAALSARVGSIGDNRLGGWASYRASKAALNMLIRTLAIEQTRRSPDSIVVGLHPGTVATGLSAPFTGRVPPSRLFTADRAAGQLLDVIDGLNTVDTGGLFAWDGSRIEY